MRDVQQTRWERGRLGLIRRVPRLVAHGLWDRNLDKAVAGLALGFWSIRYVEALLYQVKATDVSLLVVPSLILFAAAFLAAVLHEKQQKRCQTVGSTKV